MRRRGNDWAKVRHRVARWTGADGGRAPRPPRGLPGAKLCCLIPPTTPKPDLKRGHRSSWRRGLGSHRMVASHDGKVTQRLSQCPAPCWAPGQGQEQGPGEDRQRRGPGHGVPPPPEQLWEGLPAEPRPEAFRKRSLGVWLPAAWLYWAVLRTQLGVSRPLLWGSTVAVDPRLSPKT